MVQAANMISETFSVVFQELNENVSSITNLAGETITLDKTESGNFWLGSYPDTELIEDRDRYPIGVLDTPIVDESIIGFRLSENNLEIDITVFDTRKEHPPKFVEKAVDVLRDNEEIKKAGLYNAQLIDTESNVLTNQRGDLKIHEYTATVQFGSQTCV